MTFKKPEKVSFSENFVIFDEVGRGLRFSVSKT